MISIPVHTCLWRVDLSCASCWCWRGSAHIDRLDVFSVSGIVCFTIVMAIRIYLIGKAKILQIKVFNLVKSALRFSYDISERTSIQKLPCFRLLSLLICILFSLNYPQGHAALPISKLLEGWVFISRWLGLFLIDLLEEQCSRMFALGQLVLELVRLSLSRLPSVSRL